MVINHEEYLKKSEKQELYLWSWLALWHRLFSIVCKYMKNSHDKQNSNSNVVNWQKIYICFQNNLKARGLKQNYDLFIFLKESKVKQPLCSTTHLIYQRAELEQTAGHLQQRVWYGPGDGETFSVSAAARVLAVGPALQFQTRQPARPPPSTWSHWQWAAVLDSHHSTSSPVIYGGYPKHGQISLTGGVLLWHKRQWPDKWYHYKKLQNFNVFGSEWTARHLALHSHAK